MRKTATKLSGILTLIFSVLLTLVSILLLISSQVEMVGNIINNIPILMVVFFYVYYIFAFLPASLVGMIAQGVSLDTLQFAFTIVLLVFSLFMLFCGIKEILIAKREDEDFAHCKKTCWFFALTKFMFFLYVLFVIVGTFLIEDIKMLIAILELIFISVVGVENLVLIITIAIAVIALILFLLPVINVCHVAKVVKANNANNQNYNPNNQNQMQGDPQNGYQQNPNQFYQTTPRPTMQANMPPVPGYGNQNLNAQSANAPMPNNANNLQPTNQNPNSVAGNMAQQSNVNPAMPQQMANPQGEVVLTNSRGEPLSDKAKADLDRLERLKAMGSITEENYEVMKRKIIEGN